LYDLNVSPNVESGVEEVYDQVLTEGLAHFSGTSLPISQRDTHNIVIYGHSSAGDYYERTKDPAAAFSRLSKIRYGDEIEVNIDGKTYKYKFIKGKTVEANDLSILEGQRGQKYLTLFTCYPNGNNDKRFVATARLIEE
jgi:LPXTG-site transpeptidase (sortase) family protein